MTRIEVTQRFLDWDGHSVNEAGTVMELDDCRALLCVERGVARFCPETKEETKDTPKDELFEQPVPQTKPKGGRPKKRKE